MLIHVRRATALAAVVLAAGFTAAACSSSSSTPSSAAGTGSTMPSMTMSAPAAASSAAVPVSGDSVGIKNFAFAPAALTVHVGTKVTWTNQDADAHTVTSQNNSGPLNSQALATGQSYSYTFTKSGTYSYLCTIHPFMTATVTVTQ